jgi:hypothetical protein
VVPLRPIEAHLGERRYSSYSFLTSALEGGELSASRPGRPLPPDKEPPVPTVQEAGWAPQPVWTLRLCINSNYILCQYTIYQYLRIICENNHQLQKIKLNWPTPFRLRFLGYIQTFRLQALSIRFSCAPYSALSFEFDFIKSLEHVLIIYFCSLKLFL